MLSSAGSACYNGAISQMQYKRAYTMHTVLNTHTHTCKHTPIHTVIMGVNRGLPNTACSTLLFFINPHLALGD